MATLLDEVMAWSLVAEDNWGVTARMSVEYRRPTPIGSPSGPRAGSSAAASTLVDTAAQLVDADGTVLAKAEGRYVAADETRKRELQARYGYRARAARNGTAADTTDPVDAR